MPHSPPPATSQASLPAWIATLVVVVGLLVLGGWAAGIETLKRVSPGLVAMNPATAVLFVLSGVSLWLQRASVPSGTPGPGLRQQLARVLAALVVLVAVLKLGDVLLGWSTGVDQWLFADKLVQAGDRHPNRMAPNTALNFVFLGSALLLVDLTTARGRRPSEALGALVGLAALMGVLGYVYRLTSMYQLFGYIPMALHTAVLFMLVALGVLAARPRLGFMAVMTGASMGGTLVRRLYPTLVLTVAAIGWLRLEGERRGLYGAELGVTLYTIAFIALFTVLIVWSAGSLDRAEAARRLIEAERERFFAMTPDMLCTSSFDGVFRSVNPAWQKLLGYSPGELMSRPFLAFVHPDDRDATAAAMGGLADGEAVLSFENRYCRKDGEYLWFSWNAIPAVAEGLVYATARDVTQRKQAQDSIHALNAELNENAAQLQHTNRELEAFSYSISHDLRAPLRHINGYARMLQEDAGDQLDAEMRRYLDAIADAARQMGSLIDDLLAFARLGRKPIDRSLVDMDALVAQSLRDVGSAGDGRVVVGPLPPVHADPVLLRQVWVNLLSNALKYSAPRADAARIEVTGERQGDQVLYRIRDNGVGFDMRYADKLFGVFQRLHSQDEFEGTGVGLAIVQRIVVRHGGTIAAQGAPGLGATFTFHLPWRGDDGPPAPAQESSA